MGAAFILLPLVGDSFDRFNPAAHDIWAASVAIIITAVISSAAAISNDTMQDLKAGYMVGATPWKQQIMLMLGVAVAALVIPLILSLLFEAYGLGGVYPRSGMDPSQTLLAPQATLMAAVVKGIFTHNVPWSMIGIGAIIAVITIMIDAWLKPRGKRLPVLAVGLGVYLPFVASMPLILGSFISFFVYRRIHKHCGNLPKEEAKSTYEHKHEEGLLLACGLVAGAAIMGVLLAIPFALKGSSDVLSLVSAGFGPYAQLISLIVTAILAIWIYQTICKDI